jgi:hypothetical protein
MKKRSSNSSILTPFSVLRACREQDFFGEYHYRARNCYSQFGTYFVQDVTKDLACACSTCLVSRL